MNKMLLNKDLLIKLKFIFVVFILFSFYLNERKNFINVHKTIQKKKNCSLSPENSNIKIVHIIITRFMIEFFKAHGFNKKIYTPKYIKNGIRVMRKYLLPSLEFQSCKDFIWMLKIGNKANINYLKTLLHFKSSFKIVIIYDKDHRNYIRNITKNADVLITTRIDYDDRIYYDAVNDVRKAVNKSKPMFLYGYARGFIYYEDFDLYFEYFNKFKNKGASSIFESLIIFMNKVNDSYTINDLGEHFFVKKNLLQNYKKFGLEKLNYKPAIFEIDNPKFVWVRQKYSGTILQTNILKQKKKPVYFDLAKFYGLKNK